MATVFQELPGLVTSPAAAETSTDTTMEIEPSFEERIRKLLWVSSGMFSVVSLGLAFTGYAAMNAYQAASSNFLAAIGSAVLFGIASLLKYGPDSD